MRKMMLLAAMVAIAALMLAAAPAMAQDRNDDDFCDFFDCNNDDDFCDFFDCINNNNNVVPAITQDFDQEAESGDVDQTFDVSQTGDNSNQTAGIQGVANTGNAQNQIGVVDAGGFGNFEGNDFFNNGDEFCDEFDEFCEDLEDFCDDNDDDGFCDDFFDDGNRFFFDDDDDFFDDGNRFFGNNGSDFEFGNVGSSIEVSPTNTTSSDQEVNQAATAAG
jgi:opacity protein-like surface antigen